MSTQGSRRIIPLIQGTHAECGLVCVAMVLQSHGAAVDLDELRSQWNCGLRGLRLGSLKNILEERGMVARPLKVSLEDLERIKTPSIMHWDFCHYVVVERISKRKIVVVDPAMGRRAIPLAQVSNHFTGVVLEVQSKNLKQERYFHRNAFGLKDIFPTPGQLLRAAAPALALTAIANVATLVFPLFMKFGFEQVIPSSGEHLLNAAFLVFVGCAAVHYATLLARSRYVALLRNQVSYFLSSRLFGSLIWANAAFFETRPATRLSNQYTAIQGITATVTEKAIVIGVDALFILCGLLMLAVTSPAGAAVVAAGVVIQLSISSFSNAEMFSRMAECLHAEAIEHDFIVETVENMTAIRTFFGEPTRIAVWENVHSAVSDAQGRCLTFTQSRSALQDMVGNVSWLAMIYLALRSALSGEFTTGAIAAAVTWASVILVRSKELSSGIVAWQLLRSHVARLEDMIRSPKVQLTDGYAPSGRGSQCGNFDLAMDSVWFRYDHASPWIISDCSMRIEPGVLSCITGPSGAGKTTFLKLLVGLLEPSRGCVTINGTSGQSATECVARLAGLVMQSDRLLSGTMLDNISFFDVDPDVGLAAECAKAACIDDFIEMLPSGYRTLIVARGGEFSAGQVQRLLLARALYRRPRLLLLDEFSSNLDEDIEMRILLNLRAMSVTTISVAHRPQVIASAARVYRIEKGHIFERAAASSFEAA